MSEGAVVVITIIIRKEKKRRIREGVSSSNASKNATLCYARSVCRHVDKSLYTVLKAQ
jgi:hypothetical protein